MNVKSHCLAKSAALPVVLVTLLAACSKEPEPTPPSMAMLDEAISSESETAKTLRMDASSDNVPQETVECLEAKLAEDVRVNAIVKHVSLTKTYPYETSIPSDRFLYWGHNATVSETCAKLGVTDAFDGPVSYYPFEAINKTALLRIEKQSTYSPSPKGEFETTAEYESRIAKERSEHEAKHAGDGFNINDFGKAWLFVMGVPQKNYGGREKYLPKYDPDTEILEFTVESALSQKDKNSKTGDTHPSFSIPVRMKVPRASVKAFVESLEAHPSLDRHAMAILMPHVAMELVANRLIVREVAMVPHDQATNVEKQIVADAFKAGGFNFDRIKVDYEVPYQFGN